MFPVCQPSAGFRRKNRRLGTHLACSSSFLSRISMLLRFSAANAARSCARSSCVVFMAAVVASRSACSMLRLADSCGECPREPPYLPPWATHTALAFPNSQGCCSAHDGVWRGLTGDKHKGGVCHVTLCWPGEPTACVDSWSFRWASFSDRVRVCVRASRALASSRTRRCVDCRTPIALFTEFATLPRPTTGLGAARPATVALRVVTPPCRIRHVPNPGRSFLS